MKLTIANNSRAEHSSILSNIDTVRISRQLEKIIFTEKIQEFHKVENILYGKYENMEIMTFEELDKQIDEAFNKIVSGENN